MLAVMLNTGLVLLPCCIAALPFPPTSADAPDLTPRAAAAATDTSCKRNVFPSSVIHHCQS